MAREVDAVVVGSGPNGLAAGVALAQAGKSVIVFEASSTPGGGTRTLELTLPGFHHDICSAVHPLGISSPFLRSLPLQDHGLHWLHPEIPLAHPFDDGSAAVLRSSLSETAALLERDGDAYTRLFSPFVNRWDELLPMVLAPLRPPAHPWLMGRFGLHALQSARSFAELNFERSQTRGLFAGLAAHATLPLENIATASFGLVLGAAAHTHGWPVAEGGSQSITRALTSLLESLGGQVVVGHPVRSLTDLPPSRVVLFNTTPKQLVQIAGDVLSRSYRTRVAQYRYGPGAFKVDFALDGPVPWTADACRRAGTVHLGGTFDEIADAEHTVGQGSHVAKPYVLVAQQSLIDPSRAPNGQHTLWAYTHVPSGSSVSMTDAIESQIERYAPGFRKLILARHEFSPVDFERYNANCIGGDINGGTADLAQLFTRPITQLDPYATSNPRIFLCSSSTPPGGGVHGMCGYHAARSALRRLRRTA